jgi:hypothetical protein
MGIIAFPSPQPLSHREMEQNQKWDAIKRPFDESIVGLEGSDGGLLVGMGFDEEVKPGELEGCPCFI